VVGRWNALDQHTVDAPSMKAFKGKVDKLWHTRVSFLWLLQGVVSAVRIVFLMYITFALSTMMY